MGVEQPGEEEEEEEEEKEGVLGYGALEEDRVPGMERVLGEVQIR